MVCELRRVGRLCHTNLYSSIALATSLGVVVCSGTTLAVTDALEREPVGSDSESRLKILHDAGRSLLREPLI